MGYRGFLLLPVLAVALAVSTACGNEAAGDGLEDTEAYDRELGFEPAETQKLLPGEMLEIAVACRDREGRPAAGVQVTLALLGKASGASLDDLSPRTDKEGFARAKLRAGSDASTFRVRAIAEGAEPAYLEIAVAKVAFRMVKVAVEYAGQRAIPTLTVTARPNVECNQALDDNMPGPVNQTLTNYRAHVTLNLDPGVPYAILVWGRGESGGLLARGCEGIEYHVEDKGGEEPASLVVGLVDHELDLAPPEGGAFAIEFELDVSASSARLGAAAREAGRAVLPKSAEPDADALLDAIEADVTKNRGEAAAQSIKSLRAEGTIAQSLGGILRTQMLGPTQMLAELDTLLATRAERLVAGANYAVAVDSSMALQIQTLYGSRASGLPLPLSAALLASTYVSFSATFEEARAEIAIAELGLTLPLHAYGLAVFDAIDMSQANGLLGMLSSPLGCQALSTWGASQATIASACDSACLQRACDAVGKGLLGAARARVAQPSSAHSKLSLKGQVGVADRDDNNVVDAIGSTSPLEGTWHGDVALPDADVVTGELRMAPPPLAP